MIVGFFKVRNEINFGSLHLEKKLWRQAISSKALEQEEK